LKMQGLNLNDFIRILNSVTILAISNRACSLLDAGDREGYNRLMNLIPMPPYLAKVAKERIGIDYLIDGGWNLSEAEAEFGVDWLNK